MTTDENVLCMLLLSTLSKKHLAMKIERPRILLRDFTTFYFFSFQNLAGYEAPDDTDAELPKDVIESEEDFD